MASLAGAEIRPCRGSDPAHCLFANALPSQEALQEAQSESGREQGSRDSPSGKVIGVRSPVLIASVAMRIPGWGAGDASHLSALSHCPSAWMSLPGVLVRPPRHRVERVRGIKSLVISIYFQSWHGAADREVK